MKILTFSSLKKPLLAFEAEVSALSPHAGGEEGEFILTAEGRTVQQEMPAIEEMAMGDYACYFSVSENGEEQLHARCLVMLITFEPEHLVARITLET